MWLKIWKSYSEGPGEFGYLEYENEKDIKRLIEYWEEEEYWDDGNHKILWEKVDKPPKEWLDKEIKEITKLSKSLYKNYRRNKINIEETIKKYKSFLK
jgi:hypothetical protein